MSILSDDSSTNTPDAPMTDDAAVASLMDRWSPKADKADEDTSTPKADEVQEDEGEGYEAEGEPEVEETEEEAEGTPEDTTKTPEAEKVVEAPKELADDTVIKVKVGDQEVEATLAQAKRAIGQEAAVTRKSQELDVVGQRTANTLRAVIEDIESEYEENYAGVDWLVVKDEMDPVWFEFHRARASELEAKHARYIGAAQAVQTVQAVRQNEVDQEARTRASEVLKSRVPEWSDAHDTQIVDYMVSQGIDGESAKALMDPVAKILVHKARLYDEGKAKAAEKVNKEPPKANLTPAGKSTADLKSKALENAESRLKSGKGSDDDAVAILMGRWSRKSR